MQGAKYFHVKPAQQDTDSVNYNLTQKKVRDYKTNASTATKTINSIG